MDALGLDPWLLVWQGLSFLILLWLLRRYAYKPVLKMLDDRAERVRTSMEQAEQIRRELNEAQASAQQVIQDARREGEAMRAQIQQSNQRLIAAAQAEAREQRDKIIRDAREQIQAETERAKLELRQEVGRLAISAASRIIGQELKSDPRLHDQLIADALSGVDRNN